jgi:pimeloyl-ACP methyl ester carboxylesterase
MLLTREEQIDTLYAAVQAAGIDVPKDEIDWRDEHIDSNGLELHYIDWGTRGKPPLLLLHGGMQNAHSWDTIAVALKRDYHVVALDLRGHGDSAWSDEGDYSHETHGNDAANLVEQLGWQRLSLIGLSLGGLSSIQFAVRHTDILDRLVIVDVGPQLNSRGVGKIIEFGQGPAEFDSIDGFIERALEYNPLRKPEQLRYSLTHNLRRLPNGNYTWKYDRRVARRPPNVEELASQYFAQVWERLRDISCPTLIVRGADSEVFPEETGHRMVELIPDCRFVTVPNAGHTVPQDNPRDFLAAVRPFLEATASP